MIFPQRFEQLAAANRGGGVFETTEVARVAVIEAEGGGGFEEDDRIVARQLGGMGGADVVPERLRTFGPVRRAVDGAAVEQQGVVGMRGGEARFLVELETIHAALGFVSGFQVELVPTRLQQ